MATTKVKHKDIGKVSFLTSGTSVAYTIERPRFNTLPDRLRIALKFHTTNTGPSTLEILCNGSSVTGPKDVHNQEGLAVAAGELKNTGAYEVEYDLANNRYIVVSGGIGTKRSVEVDQGEIQLVGDEDIPKDYTAYMIKGPLATDRGFKHPLQRDVVPVGYEMTVLPNEQLVLGGEFTIEGTLDLQGTLVLD